MWLTVNYVSQKKKIQTPYTDYYPNYPAEIHYNDKNRRYNYNKRYNLNIKLKI